MRIFPALFIVLIVFSTIGCAPKKEVQMLVPKKSQTGPSIQVLKGQKTPKALDIADNYPGPWQTGSKLRIDSILTKNNVKNYFPYEYRMHSTGRSYLLKCNNETYYVVWLGQEIVGGPYKKRKGSVLKD